MLTRACVDGCVCLLIPLQRMLPPFLASLSLSLSCPLSLVNYTEMGRLSSLIRKDTTPRRADPVTLLLILKSSTHKPVDTQKLLTEDADATISFFLPPHEYIQLPKMGHTSCVLAYFYWPCIKCMFFVALVLFKLNYFLNLSNAAVMLTCTMFPCAVKDSSVIRLKVF